MKPDQPKPTTGISDDYKIPDHTPPHMTQPKPTGDELTCDSRIPQQSHLGHITKPKPTSGEWFGSIGGLITQDGKPVGNALSIEAAKQIADAHNAALAAADANAKSWHDDTVRCEEEICDLKRQLAAEAVRSIESMTRVQQQVNDQAKEIQQLREQLAAEREKREQSDRKWIIAAGQLRDQLAAEREKVQQLEKRLAQYEH